MLACAKVSCGFFGSVLVSNRSTFAKTGQLKLDLETWLPDSLGDNTKGLTDKHKSDTVFAF